MDILINRKLLFLFSIDTCAISHPTEQIKITGVITPFPPALVKI